MFSLCRKYETEKEKLLPWGPKNKNLMTNFINDENEDEGNNIRKELEVNNILKHILY